jgi:hypothetical protein
VFDTAEFLALSSWFHELGAAVPVTLGSHRRCALLRADKLQRKTSSTSSGIPAVTSRSGTAVNRSSRPRPPHDEHRPGDRPEQQQPRAGELLDCANGQLTGRWGTEPTEQGRALMPRLPLTFARVAHQLFADFSTSELN